MTGASRGLGAGIALRFAQAGASVGVNYCTGKQEADQVVARIKTLGPPAVALQADVTRPDQVEGLVTATVKQLGGLDILVNNAGTYPVKPLLELSLEEWEAVQAANLRSVYLCTRAAAQKMIAQGRGGAIINITTIEAENPAPDHSHYAAAKAGVAMFTQSSAQELGRHNIRVNAVSPGLIWRPGLDQDWPEGVHSYLQAAPLGRLGQVEDIANACLFLASSGAGWITGASLRVDGGVMTSRIY